MGDLTDSVAPSSEPHRPRPMPVREDCWSEEATSTLIDAWGRRYLELNRGNLRQKDWQEVADAVNALHGNSKKTHRTDVQCKNRIDTIKKKYKIEKARVVNSNDALASSWVFFDRVDMLVGPSSSAKKTGSSSPSVAPLSPPMALPLPYKKTPSLSPRPLATVLPQKRPSDRGEEGFFRRNYSAMAAAAAAAEAEDEDEEETRESDEEEEEEEEEEGGEGIRKLAKAIEKFGEVYQRVEAEKLRQMVDLEKQRMKFAKDVEMQRLKMFMDTQVQLERIRHTKRSSDSDEIYARKNHQLWTFIEEEEEEQERN